MNPLLLLLAHSILQKLNFYLWVIWSCLLLTVVLVKEIQFYLKEIVRQCALLDLVKKTESVKEFFVQKDMLWKEEDVFQIVHKMRNMLKINVSVWQAFILSMENA